MSSCLCFFVYTPRSGIAGAGGSSVFNSWGTPTRFCTVAALCNIPASSVQGFEVPRILCTGSVLITWQVKSWRKKEQEPGGLQSL